MRFLLISTFVVMASGCGITDFDLSQPIEEQTVTGNPIPSPIQGLFPLPLNLELSAKIRKQTTGPIDSVTLSTLALNITGTEQQGDDVDDFAFIGEIHVFVRSALPDSGLPRVEIATEVSPGDVQNFNFDVDSSIDLLPYIEEGSVVESEATGTAPPDTVSYDGQAVFTVHPL